MQADGHRLLELVHVEADAQMPGGHVLERDLGLVHAFGFAQQAVFRSLTGQALTQCVGLIMHGLLELQAHDHGVNHQCQGDQNHVMAGNTQSQRNAAIAQGPEDQQEEVIGFDRRWPVH